MIVKIYKDNHFISKLGMSDEAHFHLNWFIYKQNIYYLADKNLTQLHYCSLHWNKITVWCAAISQGTKGLFYCFIFLIVRIILQIKSRQFGKSLFWKPLLRKNLQTIPKIITNAGFNKTEQRHSQHEYRWLLSRLFKNLII